MSKSYDGLHSLRRVRQVLMLEVAEGLGTDQNPLRTVRYFIDKDGERLGRIDDFVVEPKPDPHGFEYPPPPVHENPERHE